MQRKRLWAAFTICLTFALVAMQWPRNAAQHGAQDARRDRSVDDVDYVEGSRVSGRLSEAALSGGRQGLGAHVDRADSGGSNSKNLRQAGSRLGLN